jgi:WD40 repeat protein
VAVTPDGRRAVSGAGDKTLKLWDLERGCVEETLHHTNLILGLAVHPDAQRIIACLGNYTDEACENSLKIWDLETRRLQATLLGHEQGVTKAAIAPDGKRAVSASFDRTLKMWDLDTNACLATLKGHRDAVFGVAITPDGEGAVLLE